MIRAHSVLSLCLWLFHLTYGMPSCVKIKVNRKWQMPSHVWLFAIPRTVAYQAPLSMDFPGKNTGVGWYFLLQGIFLTQDQTWVCCTVGRFFTSLYQGSSTISLVIRKMLVKTISYHFFFLSAWLWGLSYPTRDWTQALISESTESNHWMARQLPTSIFFFFLIYQTGEDTKHC